MIWTPTMMLRIVVTTYKGYSTQVFEQMWEDSTGQKEWRPIEIVYGK